jgi:ferredoxin/flavodoxin---NADP+ reductase
MIEVDLTVLGSGPTGGRAGDVTDYPGKVRLVSVGLGEAVLAVNNAVAAPDPSVSLFPGHATATA